jgi:membrane-bound lytic murein transglycosylase D
MTIALHAAWRPRMWVPLLALTLLAGCAAPAGPKPADPLSITVAAPQPETTAAPASTPVPAAPAATSLPEAQVAGEAEPPATALAVDPLRPELRLDLDDRAARTDLWERVRRGFAMPDIDGERVRDRERWYASRPDYVQRMTERGSRYLFHIVEEVEKRGLPTELALLPFIESAYNPQAMSSAKASGMWQFIPSTGRDYALKQNVFRDDRRGVLASTRAALDYLQRLHGMFGDWHLALAAYNWGEGSVQRAIARNRKAGRPIDFASLKMPAETQLYVPKLQAVKNIVARPADYTLELPPIANHPYFLSVAIERDIDVDLAARLADMSLDEFKELNPQMNRPVILAAGTPQLLLPWDNANEFVRRLPQHRGPLASWTAWVAPKTLRPSELARQVGMSEAQLREINLIPAHMLVRAGSTLLIPRGQRETDVSEKLADNGMMTLAPEGWPLRRVAVKAGPSDTVTSLAQRHRVSAAEVARWNNVPSSAHFKSGQKVVLYLPTRVRPAATSSAAVAPRPTKASTRHARPAGPRKPGALVAQARR